MADNTNLRILTCPGTPRPGLSLPFRPFTNNPDPFEDRAVDYESEPVTFGVYQYKTRAKHTYQAAAIYFRLKSELEHYRRVNDFSSLWSPHPDPTMSITYWGSFKPKNRSTVNLDACFNQCQGCSPQPANIEKVQKVHHEAGRRLDQINLSGIYRGTLGNITYEYRLHRIVRN